MPLLITQGLGDDTPTPSACNPFYVVSAVSTYQYLELTFNLNVAALTLEAADVAFWVVTTTGIYPITVTSTAITGPTVLRLYHTEPKQGDTYTLFFPANGLQSTTGDIYDGPASYTFIGAAANPVVSIAQSIDARHVRVIFNEDVQEAGALTLGNYSFDNGLVGLAVAKETSKTYIVTTTPQTPGLTYLVTCSNIVDIAGNPI